MTPGNLTDNTQFSTAQLRELAGVQGPCVSLLQPLLPAPNELRQNQARLKAAINEAERLLAEKQIEPKQADELIAPLRQFVNDVEIGPDPGIAIYAGPDFLRHFRLQESPKEAVVVGNHFFIRPLISRIRRDRPFYILALSQKHIRLIRCTNHTSEEIELPPSVPKTMGEDLQTSKPDHVQDNKSTGGPSVGSMKGVMFSTNTDREAKDEYLRHFYKDVDRGIHDLLRNESAPLILAGVEYELPIYRDVNTYPHLADEAVRGAPDGLKGGELHKRALAAANAYFEEEFKHVFQKFDEMKGSPRATRTVKEIVPAAFDGRISHLVLADNAEYRGSFDEPTHRVYGHKNPLPGDEDLLNAAVAQTILHAGEIYVVPQNQVPDGAPAVALLRY